MGEKFCCGCMTVGQGSLVIGALHIVSSIFSVIRNSILANNLINYPDEGAKPDDPIVKHRAYFITGAFMGIFMGLAYLIVSIMLVQGCRTRNHRLAMPWLIWNYISLALAGILFVVVFFVMAFNDLLLAGFLVVIFGGIGLAIGYYFIRVVQRHVNELKGIC